MLIFTMFYFPVLLAKCFPSTVRTAEAESVYRVNEADMNAQLSELAGAIKQMDASKGASFLTVKQKVRAAQEICSNGNSP